jgi:tRNA A-37 threonylcarbamoyl transferase component Bud32
MASMQTLSDRQAAAISPPAANIARGEAEAPGHVHFAGAEASALLAGAYQALCRPLEAGWQKVKSNASRTVYRGSLGDRALYVKHYHPRSALRRMGRRLGLSHARREMRFMQFLSTHGVATAPVLAATWEPDMEWLATAAVEPSQPADAWHFERLREGPPGLTAVRQATVALARLVGRMHAAGVIHRDLHCGNVLIRQGPAGPEAVLMDLHRASRRGRLSRRSRAANLAQLLHDRRDFTTRTDRLRFLKNYLRAAGADGSLRGWQLLIEDFARRHTRRQYAERDRRTVGNNRYFRRLALGRGWHAQVVLASKRRMAGSRAAEMEFSADDWREALDHPEALLDGPDVEVAKDSASGRVVRRLLRVGNHQVDVFIKRSCRKGLGKTIVDCFRPSRAIRAFRSGHALLARHIATALPLAALERRSGPFLRDSILITETCVGTVLSPFLRTWLSRQPRTGTPLSVAQQRQIAQEVLSQLGRMVQRLHDTRFAHRDLKGANILVRWAPGLPPTQPGAALTPPNRPSGETGLAAAAPDLAAAATDPAPAPSPAPAEPGTGAGLSMPVPTQPNAGPEVVLLDLDGLSLKRHLSTSRRFQGLMRLNVSLLNCPTVNHAGRLRMLLGYLRRPGCGRIDFKPYWRVLETWSQKTIQKQIHSRRKRQKAVRRPAS